MKVLELLKSGLTLADLYDQYGIQSKKHKELPLVILNYGPGADKQCQVSRECRALVLELDTWKVVARAFPRFFNLGEVPEHEDFVFEGSVSESKEDGSLILLYHYAGEWRVNTRNGFGDNPINNTDKCYGEEVFRILNGEHDCANRAMTYVFEFTAPDNRIVRHYPNSCLHLIAAYKNPTGWEDTPVVLDLLAEHMGVKRPGSWIFNSATEVIDYISSVEREDPTFEGLVLRDVNNMRIKVKSPTYVRLHSMALNGNVTHKKAYDIKKAGDAGEFLTYFPEHFDLFEDVDDTLAVTSNRLEKVWLEHKGLETQKDFALAVKDDPLSFVLFQARKDGDFGSAFKRMEERVAERLFE